jgi:DNA mismatch endonuclease, patch repair protein
VTDNLTPDGRSQNMRRIRAKDTSPELAVRRMVHSLGFRFRLHVADLPGRPDLVFPRLRRIIEVRGCFWHQHHGCTDAHIPRSRVWYWRPKLRGNVRRDRRNERLLQELGWRVLVLWECELRPSATVRRRIVKFLRSNGS